MKRILIILVTGLLASAASASQPNLKIISFNVRVSTANDGINNWCNRAAACAQMILDEQPDICGLQEGMADQVEFLKDNCPGFVMVGVSPDANGTKGEHMSFLYNEKTVKLLDWGTFWLSETPDKASKGWDGAYPRTATWALVRDLRNEREFYYVNTHLDHVGKQAQSKGLTLIMDRIAEVNSRKLPMILTGDFNITLQDPSMAPVKARMLNARDEAETSDTAGSYNGWGQANGMIDFVWYTGFDSCLSFRTNKSPYLGCEFISDHYPVEAVLCY